MSEIPKYRESAHRRQERLGLGKPHIYWSKGSGCWMAVPDGEDRDLSIGHPYLEAVGFTIEQDQRWTPVQKD